MIDIAIQTADIGAVNHIVTSDPSFATPGLIQLASQPPVASLDTLRRMAELLLHAGADPNHHEILYHAVEHPHHAILEPILASPRLEPPWLSYCLLHKLDTEDLEGVQLMLKAGADPNLRSRTGDREMSLHHAIRRGRSATMLDLLLSHGARPDIINIHNHTARRQCIRFGRIDLGKTAPETTPLDVWLYDLWHEPAGTPPPEALNKQDFRLLPEAAWMQNLAAVSHMLAAGFPADSTTHDDLQAMDFAAYHNDERLLEVLLAYGATQEQFDAARDWLTGAH